MTVDIPECLDFDAYHAQMWNAVDSNDLFTVRKLINRWCRVDIKKGDLSLKELAFMRGTERIITLVLKMEVTLKFAHAVIENKSDEAKALLDIHRDEINVNFPNMKYMSITPLYFSIRNRNTEVTKLILSAGGKLEHCLVLHDQSELPILFHFLQWNLPDDLFDAIVCSAVSQNLFEKLVYRSQTILHWSINCSLSEDRFLHFVDLSSPRLICARDERNRTILDLASAQLRQLIVLHIKAKFEDFSENQLLLDFLSYGFDYTWEIVSEESLSPTVLADARSFERTIFRFVCAVEYGDYENVCNYSYFKSGKKELCLLNCRNMADGQPPLHKAVLKQNPQIVRHFCEVLVNTYQIKIDSIRDNYHRSALSYAYAFNNGSQEIINLLLDHGSSEFTLDKDDRSPQLFREAREHPMMEEFLKFHMSGDYRNAEMDEPCIWTTRQHTGTLVRTCYRRCCTFMTSGQGDSDLAAVLHDSDSTASSASDSDPRMSSNSFTCAIL